jgi:hypothetical protein
MLVSLLLLLLLLSKVIFLLCFCGGELGITLKAEIEIHNENEIKGNIWSREGEATGGTILHAEELRNFYSSFNIVG